MEKSKFAKKSPNLAKKSPILAKNSSNLTEKSHAKINPSQPNLIKKTCKKSIQKSSPKKNIEIDEIDIGSLVFEGVYTPEYPKLWYGQQIKAGKTPQESYKNVKIMGYNGSWKFGFESLISYSGGSKIGSKCCRS